MASLGELGRLTEAEYTDLNKRVDQFHDAWRMDPGASLESFRPPSLEAFLPPRPARHRPFVLVELIKTEMELKAKAGFPVRVEPYLERYRDEIPPTNIPVSMLAEEYRLRHAYGDKPSLGEYQSRFPEHYPVLLRIVRLATPAPMTRAESDSVNGTLVRPPQITPDGRPTVSPLPRPDDSTRTHEPVRPGAVGRGYRLLRELGRGAFGQVYEAEAPGGVRVAMKKILRDVDHPASQSELQALEAVKQMRHPFLLQTQAFWVEKERDRDREWERLVIVMELADGSLADWVDEAKSQGQIGVSRERLLPFFEQAAKGLDFLHSFSISHRDIKPQNLLHLKGFAKVADFGLARGHEHVLTVVGHEVGTPLFMAPEVWNYEVSLHSDQYSLAAAYVAARLGRPLYQTRRLPELGYKHVHEVPDLNPLPEAEQRVLLKALSKKPDDRYPTCLAFAEALQQAAAPPSWWTRRTVLLLGGSVLLGVGLAAGGYRRAFPAVASPPPSPPPPVGEPDLWCPPHWEPVQDGKTVISPDWKKSFHQRLRRVVAGEELRAIAIVPRPGHDDPPLFYMLENKISNRVFREMWSEVEKNRGGQLAEFRQGDRSRSPGEKLLPGEWERGVEPPPGGMRLGSTGEQAVLPAMGVTVPEAILVAAELGGLLPLYRHWRKATGADFEDQQRPSTLGLDSVASVDEVRIRDVIRNHRVLGIDAIERAADQHGVIALRLNHGPWPVDRKTLDESTHGIHQLVTNGKEWTAEDAANRTTRLGLQNIQTIPFTAFVVGENCESRNVITFEKIRNHDCGERRWTEWDAYAGFRIILEPK